MMTSCAGRNGTVVERRRRFYVHATIEHCCRHLGCAACAGIPWCRAACALRCRGRRSESVCVELQVGTAECVLARDPVVLHCSRLYGSGHGVEVTLSLWCAHGDGGYYRVNRDESMLKFIRSTYYST